jgi:hypothetical protein
MQRLHMMPCSTYRWVRRAALDAMLCFGASVSSAGSLYTFRPICIKFVTRNVHKLFIRGRESRDNQRAKDTELVTA